MDMIFKGFNLDIKLSGNAPDFVYLRDKFVLKAENKITQNGLKNYHLDHVDNTWGTTFITLS
jgi:hypothetical protein